MSLRYLHLNRHANGRRLVTTYAAGLKKLAGVATRAALRSGLSALQTRGSDALQGLANRAADAVARSLTSAFNTLKRRHSSSITLDAVRSSSKLPRTLTSTISSFYPRRSAHVKRPMSYGSRGFLQSGAIRFGKRRSRSSRRRR